MTPDASTTTPQSNPNLLADLESRQDELLRLLGELEERTKQALANLTAAAQSGNACSTNAKPAIAAVATTNIAAEGSAATAAATNGDALNGNASKTIIVGSNAAAVNASNVEGEKKSARSSLRSRSRKAA